MHVYEVCGEGGRYMRKEAKFCHNICGAQRREEKRREEGAKAISTY